MEESCAAKRVEELASEAQRQLSWLVGFHLGVNESTRDIQERAAGLMMWPEQYFEALPFHLECMRLFSRHAKAPPAYGADHYFNKVAVVYAVAILEAFVRRAYEAKTSVELYGDSLNFLVDVIAGHKEPKPKGNTHVCVPDFYTQARAVLFLANLRHVIVHNSGIVDEDFLKRCQGLWDTAIWNNFETRYLIGSQIYLDEFNVIIPYVKSAIEFVEYTKNALFLGAEPWRKCGP